MMAPPRRSPAQLRLHSSNALSRRRGSPVARAGRPECPAFLAADPIAVREWNRACDELHDMGLLAPSDAMAIAVYVEATTEFVRATERIRTEGVVSVTDKGNVIQHPLVGVKNSAASRALKAAAVLGLTKRGRLGLEGTVSRDDDDAGDPDEQAFGVPKRDRGLQEMMTDAKSRRGENDAKISAYATGMAEREAAKGRATT